VKQTKTKTKLPFSTETIRSLSKSVADKDLEAVVGGSLNTKIITRCADTSLCTG